MNVGRVLTAWVGDRDSSKQGKVVLGPFSLSSSPHIGSTAGAVGARWAPWAARGGYAGAVGRGPVARGTQKHSVVSRANQDAET